MSDYSYLKNNRVGGSLLPTIPLPTARQSHRARVKNIQKLQGTLGAQRAIARIEADLASKRAYQLTWIEEVA